MPRYFFHMHHARSHSDTEGTELDSATEARNQAISYLGVHLRDNPNLLSDDCDLRIEVTDASDMILFTVMALAIDAPANITSRPRAEAEQDNAPPKREGSEKVP